MKVYKLFRERKDGTLGSLIINKKAVIRKNRWLRAKAHRTDGFKYRPGWHTVQTPDAPHLSMKGRAWYEVEIEDYYELDRPKHQGNTWYIAKRMKVLGRL